MKKIDLYNSIIDRQMLYSGKIFLTCCISVDFDYDILPHFIKYYKDLGVDEFLIVLNTKIGGSDRLAYCQDILRDNGIEEKMIWEDEYDPVMHTDILMKLNKKYVDSESWIMTIDVDEFHEYPFDLRKFITYCEENNINFVSGRFVDRLTSDGKIVSIDINTNLFEAFPEKAEIFRNTFHGCHWKVMLHKAYLELIPGQHFVDESEYYTPKGFPEVLSVNHFKWRGDLIENNAYRRALFIKNKDRWKNHMYKGSDWTEECGKVVDEYKKRGTFKKW